MTHPSPSFSSAPHFPPSRFSPFVVAVCLLPRLPFPCPSEHFPPTLTSRRPFLVLSTAFPFQAIQQHCQKASAERARREGERERASSNLMGLNDRKRKRAGGRTDGRTDWRINGMIHVWVCDPLRSFVCSAASALALVRSFGGNKSPSMIGPL